MSFDKRIEAANTLILLENRSAITFLFQNGLFDKDIDIADEVLDILTKHSKNRQKVISICMDSLKFNLQEIKNKDRLIRAIEILGNLKYLGAVEILNDYAIHFDPQISNIARQALEKIGFSNRKTAPINATLIQNTGIHPPTIAPFNMGIAASYILQAI